ncbi:hypothetical protein EN851_21300 [Mesorhizobium sp. M8A.F.Ca.ET.208.01.1.1]|uniref:hypothetical protein n=1 Tax=unclassified Mesorhizobium TaxID=325217 RepID=UPI001093EB55|nr:MULTISPECIES: hypothetical protein [unclassified Mesorhizobium]TGQ90151.1 hypothetical protein EN851_21300 [Mesorhizobium sp. M8A.F.Ca.ET.208.01.1.1]TGT50991.1 hypothetical protein EN810_21200 [Mesorhizobium sp. M8A.F.Ca.ET.167.01.1.1]
MKTLSQAGWDGNYVVPNQRVSRSLSGPVILLNNWFGWQELELLSPERMTFVRKLGYLPDIPTNRWLDRALEIVGMTRQDIYVTQACVFLPPATMGSSIASEVYRTSVDRVLRHELGGRTPVALGGAAQKACRLAGIDYVGAQHPSYQGGERRGREIAAAIERVL